MFPQRVDTMSMMPPGGVRRIDRNLIHPSDEKGAFTDVLMQDVNDLAAPEWGTPIALHKLTVYDSLSSWYRVL
jgi:hypothetical protein